MADSCILLEALKQLVDAGGSVVGSDTGSSDLIAMSKKSASRASQLRSALCRKKQKSQRKTASAPALVSVPTPSPVLALTPTPTPVPEVVPHMVIPNTSIVFHTPQAKLVNNRLRMPFEKLQCIVKGNDYFSINLNEALTLFKDTLTTKGSFGIVLSTGNVVEFRDAYDITYSQEGAVEFTLGDSQLMNGGELTGVLSNVNLFTSNLP